MTYKKNSPSNKTDWITPLEIIRPLGEFDLDPCCPNIMPWATAKRMLSQGYPTALTHSYREVLVPNKDGFLDQWYGRVWLNPPYGREQDAWLEKLAAHGNGIALIPASTGTYRWEKLVFPKSTAICFVRGRIPFCLPDGTPVKNNMHDSALVAFGMDNATSLIHSDLGYVVKREEGF